MVPTFTCGLVRSNFFFAMSLSFALRLTLLRDLRRDARRENFVVAWLHRIRTATLRLRAQVGRVSEHRRERHVRGDDARVRALFHPVYVATTAVEVTDHVAHELLGHGDLDLHDGLLDDRPAPVDRLLERERARDLERHLRGVDIVLRAVDDGGLYVDDRIARDDAVLHRLAHALLDGLGPLLRERGALDAPLELEAGAALERLELRGDVAVLALAAGLPDPASLRFQGLGDRLAVRDLRTADVRGDLELTQHAVDDDLEVQLAHAGDDRLT